MPEVREETRRETGARTYRTSAKESRTPSEPKGSNAPVRSSIQSYIQSSVQKPTLDEQNEQSSYRVQRVRNHSDTSTQNPTRTYTTSYSASTQDSIGPNTTSYRKVETRPRTGRDSNIGDQHVERTDHARSSDKIQPQSFPISRVVTSRSSQAVPEDRSGKHNLIQNGNPQPVKQSARQQALAVTKVVNQPSRGLTSLNSREGVMNFILLVEKGDYAAFGRIVNADPELVNSNEFRDTIRRWATTAIRNGEQRHADRCAKTLALINVWRTFSSTRTTYFLRSLIEENDPLVKQEFKRACVEELQAAKGSESERLIENPADHGRVRNDDTLSHQAKKREMPQAKEDSRKMSRTMPPDTDYENLEMDFPVRQTAWFVPGKLFKRCKTESRDDGSLPRSSNGSPATQQSRRTRGQPDRDSLSISSAQSNRSKNVYYLLVIRVAPEFCTVLRASSYRSPGTFPRSYAILYSEASEPQSGGPGFVKKPIKIDLASRADRLPTSMLVDFERQYEVKLPTPAEEVGKVASSSMEYVMRYFEECNTL